VLTGLKAGVNEMGVANVQADFTCKIYRATVLTLKAVVKIPNGIVLAIRSSFATLNYS